MFYEFIIKYTYIFCGKKWEELTAKASNIFSTKHTGVFEILMFEILTSR